MKIKAVTAEEARKQATLKRQEIECNKRKKERDLIIEEINCRITMGCFYYFTEDNLYEETINYLRDLGYDVSTVYDTRHLPELPEIKFRVGTKIEW